MMSEMRTRLLAVMVLLLVSVAVASAQTTPLEIMLAMGNAQDARQRADVKMSQADALDNDTWTRMQDTWRLYMFKRNYMQEADRIVCDNLLRLAWEKYDAAYLTRALGHDRVMLGWEAEVEAHMLCGGLQWSDALISFGTAITKYEEAIAKFDSVMEPGQGFYLAWIPIAQCNQIMAWYP